MAFECLCCGVCCRYLGPYHEAYAVPSDPYVYDLEFTPSGERMQVSVSEEMAHLLSDTSVFEKYPESCPFLRYISETEARCIIHSTRPDYCKKSGCYDYLICDQDGIICGKIKSRFVIGADEGVSQILLNYSDIVSRAPYDVFIKTVTDALREVGYIVS
ncbi:MAG: hypothetical protein LBV40_04955 [Methanomicrobiales archaeon]|nr:hypothetical protein [Methanomicrobiales archaeon]